MTSRRRKSRSRANRLSPEEVLADPDCRREVEEHHGRWVLLRRGPRYEINGNRRRLWSVLRVSDRPAETAGSDEFTFRVPDDWRSTLERLAETITDGVWVRDDSAALGGKIVAAADTRTPEQRRAGLPPALRRELNRYGI